ncbi:hypothetical protein SE15_02830 [Thermanaerothrix daxensis]|uniref:Negative regulator of flagellin synthesis n=1 Tax=Thermanaerothrix daxensis TaxID=869279 RepID=A0A0P6XX81_9CHLR|nr:flagellar biosynthesis anti-sigma factor FlgM [Thermanaerothrix daxensis]KPL84127.1 hypothetical protein SE15_02830 [Thermanaerothrix daxensis]
MKIENNSIHSLASSRAQNTSAAGHTAHSNEATPPSTTRDRAELSEQARMLAKARNALNEAPAVRNERIEQLRQQIEDGTYKIPLEALANQLLKRLK